MTEYTQNTVSTTTPDPRPRQQGHYSYILTDRMLVEYEAARARPLDSIFEQICLLEALLTIAIVDGANLDSCSRAFHAFNALVKTECRFFRKQGEDNSDMHQAMAKILQVALDAAVPADLILNNPLRDSLS